MLIVDLYGTLATLKENAYPTGPHPYVQAYAELAQIIGRPAGEIQHRLMRQGNSSLADSCNIAFPKLNLSKDGLTQIQKLEQSLQRFNQCYELVSSATAVLDALRALDRHVVLLSNATGFMQADLLVRQLGDIPATFSYAIGYAKPEKEAFATAQAGATDHQGNTVMVGDNWQSDVLGALAVGYDAVLIDASEGPLTRALLLAKKLALTKKIEDAGLLALLKALGLLDLPTGDPLASLHRVKVCRTLEQIPEAIQALCLSITE